MTGIFTAKTVDEAKAIAVKKFGKKASEIKFEVLEEGKKGFLGIGQVDAKVKATYIAPAPKPVVSAPKHEVKEVTKEEPVIKSEPAKETKKEPVKAETTIEKAEPEIIVEQKPLVVEEEAVKTETEEEVKEIKEETVESVEIAETAENMEETPFVEEQLANPEKAISEEVKEEAKKEDDENFALEDFALIEDETLLHEKVKIARDYITSILNAMQIDAEYTIYQNETGAVINIESNNNGTIIGRRGETLDSIQYLCSIIANKGDKDYFRITIDCLSYRNKRKETLEQLASKVAKSVLRTGRSQQLEPMNPYERRVIHSAISEIEGVSSRSVGEEPYRKIVISSNNPKNSSKRRGPRRDDRRDGRKRSDKPRTPREPIEVKEIDLSTSFEKDYKKPKPEDTMEGGLYGKIEF